MRWCWIASSRRFRRATNAYETINSSTMASSKQQKVANASFGASVHERNIVT